MTDQTNTHPGAGEAGSASGVGDALPSRELEEAMIAGEITGAQAAEQLQQAARRQVAEHGPTEDTDADGIITVGGKGSGQGMQKQRTGQ